MSEDQASSSSDKKTCFRKIPCTRVICECDEFRLVEHCPPEGGEYYRGNPQTVIMNEGIRVVFEREKFRINDNRTITSVEERLSLVHLMMGALTAGELLSARPKNPEWGFWSAEEFGRQFASDIGIEMAQAAGINDREKQEAAFERIGTRLRTALIEMGKGFSVGQAKEAKDYRKYPIRLLLILTAMGIFEKTHEQPTKKEIRTALEDMGFGFKGKNANSEWEKKFTEAELGGLPEG